MIGWFKPTTLQHFLPGFSRPNIEYVTQSESVLDKSLMVHNDTIKSEMKLTSSLVSFQLNSRSFCYSSFGADSTFEAQKSRTSHLSPTRCYPQMHVCPRALPSIHLLLMLNSLVFLKSLIQLGSEAPSLSKRLQRNLKGITGRNVWKLQFNLSFLLC